MKNELQTAPKPAALPLIRSIANELRERCLRILLLQTLLDTESVQVQEDRKRLLLAEVASNRRALRHARAEMERVGFSIVAMDPLRVCVRSSHDLQAPEIELVSRIENRAS